MKYCHSCKKVINLLSIQFCPYCGKKTTKNFDIKDFIPHKGIVIVFNFQDKKAFHTLYEKIKEIIKISEIGEGKSKYCFVSSPVKDAHHLFDTLGQLLYNNSYFVYENGKKLRSTNDISDSRVCCAKRIVNEIPEYYCFGVTSPSGDIRPNLVGCLQMELDISPYSSFYRTGEWTDIFGNYVFNKEKMISRANKQLKKYRFCPFINAAVIQRFIDLWPERVNVHLNSVWEFWPPRNDSFSNGLRELGLVSNTNMSGDNYKPDFPLIKDVTYFIDLAKKLYPAEISTNTQAAIYASIDAIQMNVFKGYS